jgi:hypothetical protein
MKLNKQSSGVGNYLKYLNKINIPEDWIEEGIIAPNQKAVEKYKQICKYLFTRYKINTSSVLPSKEGGICLFYNTPEVTLIIEVYNDLEVALIINENISKTIIYSETIVNNNFDKAIEVFKRGIKL